VIPTAVTSAPASSQSSAASAGRCAVPKNPAERRIAAPAQKKDALVSLHWSMVHGLATLLLDGALGARFASEKERALHVRRVLDAFDGTR
jgi:hypothetical protein